MTLAAMALVLAAWAFLALALIGVGGLVARLLGSPWDTKLSTLFWVGFCAVLLTAQLAHLALPIDWRLLLAVFLAGAAGLLLCGQGLFRRVAGEIRAHPALSAAVAIGAIWLSNRALGPPENGDSAIYHLQAVRWASSFPVVPGIANLCPFLGVNHSFFLFAAMLEVGPFANGSQHLANGILALAFLSRGLAAAGALAMRRGTGWADVASLVLLPPAVDLALGRDVMSPTADLSELALGAVLVSEWIRHLERRRQDSVSAGWPMLALIAVTAFTLKLSSAGAVAAVLLWGTGGILRRGPRRGALFVTAAVMCVALVPWAILSVVRSGYLPYYGALVSFPVDWRLPSEIERAITGYTVSFSRLTLESSADGAGWLRHWASELLLSNRKVVLPLAIAALGFALSLFARIRRWPGASLTWAVVVPALGGIVFWLLTAPDERYAGAWLWGLAASSASLAASAVGPVRLPRLTLLLVATMGIVAAYPLLGTPPLRAHPGLVPPPQPPLESFTTQSGLVLNVPLGGECSASPLPCTTCPDPRLSLRGPDELGSGFRLELGEGPDRRPPAAIEGCLRRKR
ncbi:MAG: hypothetical protein HYZ28_11080 [Myxococcales bacterium]|nr:hypothetical protein [Myxococcales bacterium]